MGIPFINLYNMVECHRFTIYFYRSFEDLLYEHVFSKILKCRLPWLSICIIDTF